MHISSYTVGSFHVGFPELIPAIVKPFQSLEIDPVDKHIFLNKTVVFIT